MYRQCIWLPLLFRTAEPVRTLTPFCSCYTENSYIIRISPRPNIRIQCFERIPTQPLLGLFINWKACRLSKKYARCSMPEVTTSAICTDDVPSSSPIHRGLVQISVNTTGAVSSQLPGSKRYYEEVAANMLRRYRAYQTCYEDATSLLRGSYEEMLPCNLAFSLDEHLVASRLQYSYAGAALAVPFCERPLRDLTFR